MRMIAARPNALNVLSTKDPISVILPLIGDALFEARSWLKSSSTDAWARSYTRNDTASLAHRRREKKITLHHPKQPKQTQERRKHGQRKQRKRNRQVAPAHG